MHTTITVYYGVPLVLSDRELAQITQQVGDVWSFSSTDLGELESVEGIPGGGLGYVGVRIGSYEEQQYERYRVFEPTEEQKADAVAKIADFKQRFPGVSLAESEPDCFLFYSSI